MKIRVLSETSRKRTTNRCHLTDTNCQKHEEHHSTADRWLGTDNVESLILISLLMKKANGKQNHMTLFYVSQWSDASSLRHTLTDLAPPPTPSTRNWATTVLGHGCLESTIAHPYAYPSQCALVSEATSSGTLWQSAMSDASFDSCKLLTKLR